MQQDVPDAPHRKPVLVAYDGSTSARRAVSWALTEAAGTGRPLTLAHVMRWPLPEVDALQLAGPVHDPARARQAANDLVQSAVAWCREAAPGITVRGEMLTGGAIDLLAKLGAEASLLVLGASGQTGSSRVLLGSSASELTRRVAVPVAVIRDDDGARTKPVVIGVDGSPAGERAVGAGFDVAARRHLRVIAVHAWSDLPLEALGIRRDDDSAPGQDDGAALLAAQLSEVRRSYPQVPVDEVVVLDRPTRALLDRAAGAALLVVGRHGRAQTADTPLGSVCHAVLHYAPCPVLLTA